MSKVLLPEMNCSVKLQDQVWLDYFEMSFMVKSLSLSPLVSVLVCGFVLDWNMEPTVYIYDAQNNMAPEIILAWGP